MKQIFADRTVGQGGFLFIQQRGHRV